MRTVTVTGRGTAREVPDTVVVRVASSHRAAGVAEALAGADSAATEIVAVGREHTEASRIGSTNLNVWPAYDNEGRPSGFEARHSLSITCTDIASAGDLLAALATKVGDRLQVEGFGLEVSDTARALDSARSGAYADARVLVAKAAAGAEFAVTQLFFRASDYADLVERVRALGCDIPILPGIMPITNLRQVARMAELSGAELPDEMVARFDGVTEPADVRRVGVQIATELCQKVLELGAPGLHFYTLNRSRATLEIFEALRITA